MYFIIILLYYKFLKYDNNNKLEKLILNLFIQNLWLF